ncbi:hypothetical protein [Klebsiella aerogenes]|uniref:hypothetical protein n=1 Tax=Klebsiella aerogenes TaxID=548 RepID=UPI001BCEC5E2|nr:hypothetical protein [Klebsiella aerogenes]
MTKSTITREESVQAVFDLKVGYRLGFADIEILKRVARMALAAMDSEPVIIVGDDSGDALSYRRLLQSFAPGTKLYRHAQPAPVVPDAATAIRACLSEFPESARDIVEECADIAENACRSSMLQAEPVTTVNKLGNSPVIGIDPASGPDRTVEVRYVAPPGYVMVPKVPTAEMQSAGASAIRIETTALNKLWTGNAVFRAMLAAAQQEVKGE